ncbi:tachykinin-like peptides receptor 86C isoform X2 [Diorhabda carinulata]|uniref:tachykinin-like peptides receptor 86C isoform X2 n=1 Tax=Diorhabda carinulata TaxID=1163345 RepID=UPI0025A192BC|nr:tachykinin-like peptides receptor 86C isoform X2 [Diorhabda carinulata]
MDGPELCRYNKSSAEAPPNPLQDTIEYDNLMSMIAQIVWSIVFLFMIITATCGNCIVIWIIVAHRRMRTVTNYFLVNLSAADLLLTTLNCIFNFIYMLRRNWTFGNWYCTVSNFIANATVAASVFTLTGISCDRYLAIVYPLEPRMSKTSSIIIIAIIWTTSMLLALPCLLYSRTVAHVTKKKHRVGCILVWPDEKHFGSTYDFWYQTTFLVVTYVVPMVLMSISYTMIGTVLWGSGSIGEKTQRQMDAIKSKRRVVKMFVLVVVIFGSCWLPYHIYFIYVYFDTKILFKKYTQHVYLGFYWLAMSNAMVNPLIYYWMNTRFRNYFKSAICGSLTCMSYGNRYDTYTYSKSANDTIKIRLTNPKEQENDYRKGNVLQNYPSKTKFDRGGVGKRWYRRSRKKVENTML